MSTDDRPLTVGEFRRALEAMNNEPPSAGPGGYAFVERALATLPLAEPKACAGFVCDVARKDMHLKSCNDANHPCVCGQPYSAHPAPVPQAQEESAGAMLQRLGMDGQLWAKEFRATAQRLGYSDMDEGWLIGWFCNAIMAGYDRRGQEQPVPQAQEKLLEIKAVGWAGIGRGGDVVSVRQFPENLTSDSVERVPLVPESTALAYRDALAASNARLEAAWRVQAELGKQLEAKERECERLRGLQRIDHDTIKDIANERDAQYRRAEAAERECERLTERVAYLVEGEAMWRNAEHAEKARAEAAERAAAEAEQRTFVKCEAAIDAAMPSEDAYWTRVGCVLAKRAVAALAKARAADATWTLRAPIGMHGIEITDGNSSRSPMNGLEASRLLAGATTATLEVTVTNRDGKEVGK